MKGNLDIDKPPLVKWYRRSDREKTRNHSALKARMQKIVNSAWGRIPPSGRIVIRDRGRTDTIWLVNEPFDLEKRTEYFSVTGRAEQWGTILNIAYYSKAKNRKQCNALENDLCFVLAHELAHFYLRNIGALAAEGANVMAERRAKHEGRWKRSGYEISDKEHRLWSAVRFCEGGAIGILDDGFVDENENEININERLADAVAISWGFGFEYAFGINCNSEDGCSNQDGYLEPEIHIIRQVLDRRQRQEDEGLKKAPGK